ncbi:OzmP [Streptomyces sp. NBC_01198]|uniref:OzmP n=1 Tax=Streptomyces sp. NBC_01198 TaxID=2903769 RepID=UPI002E0E19A6|nr:OzmP [Streptomyces sp. NBC_01198]
MTNCNVCSLSGDHPGISVDATGLCNLCRLDIAGDLLVNFRYTSGVFAEFQQAPPDPDARYDCLFMYSGGKDSTYMLDKFVNEYGKRVLAYTFDVPFESAHAADNIRLAREKIAADFVLDADDENIKKVMREVFNRPAPAKPGSYLDEKLPCASCRTFFVLRAVLHAYRNGIPYIAMCADPQQILTMESNVREIVRGFYQRFGDRLTDEVFRGELERILFAEDDELPRIVFPFIAMRHDYDPDAIVAELKAKGLYESSPLETHCTLFPLLNYYAFKHWNCMFYKLNAASHARAVRRNGTGTERSTFSIKFPQVLDITRVEERLRKVTLEIAAGQGDREQQLREVTGIFRDLDADEDAARFVATSFVDMPQVAADVGIWLP